jgi:tRNA-specific 2-thiouridylase
MMKVAVGLSGGVDSSVAAALLKENGHQVVGLFMKLWDGMPLPSGGRTACYGPDEATDIEAARAVAEQLAIPFYPVDVAAEYKAAVLDYFKGEYLAGRTPNPCIRCNQRIKFGAFISRAHQAGIDFDYFATGHYARAAYDEAKGRFLLRKGRDDRKDQSYWLAFLAQEQLARVMFPLGEYTKTEVRETARQRGLITCDKPDSQDFFAGDYKQLIGAAARPGPIIDRSGSVLGTHAGIWSYTIGQRKGLGIAARQSLYVIDFDHESNAVVVGGADELRRDGLVASHLNLIACDAIDRPREVEVKIRYTHAACAGTLAQLDHDTAAVRFKQPQTAITPGQAVVFYEDDRVLGGAVIDRAVDAGEQW